MWMGPITCSLERVLEAGAPWYPGKLFLAWVALSLLRILLPHGPCQVCDLGQITPLLWASVSSPEYSRVGVGGLRSQLTWLVPQTSPLIRGFEAARVETMGLGVQAFSGDCPKRTFPRSPLLPPAVSPAERSVRLPFL